MQVVLVGAQMVWFCRLEAKHVACVTVRVWVCLAGEGMVCDGKTVVEDVMVYVWRNGGIEESVDICRTDGLWRSDGV